jgi:uncharacterized protein YegJ (DUF2314 family)
MPTFSDGPVRTHLEYDHSITQELECDPYAFKVCHKWLVRLLEVFGQNVGRVGIEVLQNLRDGGICEFFLIDRIGVIRV